MSASISMEIAAFVMSETDEVVGDAIVFSAGQNSP